MSILDEIRLIENGENFSAATLNRPTEDLVTLLQKMGGLLESEMVTVNTRLTNEHRGKFMLTDTSAPITFTITNDTEGGWEMSEEVSIFWYGSGAVSIDVDTGVSIANANTPLTLVARGSLVGLKRVDENTWVVIGSFEQQGNVFEKTPSGFYMTESVIDTDTALSQLDIPKALYQITGGSNFEPRKLVLDVQHEDILKHAGDYILVTPEYDLLITVPDVDDADETRVPADVDSKQKLVERHPAGSLILIRRNESNKISVTNMSANGVSNRNTLTVPVLGGEMIDCTEYSTGTTICLDGYITNNVEITLPADEYGEMGMEYHFVQVFGGTAEVHFSFTDEESVIRVAEGFAPALRGRFSVATLKKVAPTIWLLFGDLMEEEPAP